VYRQKRRLWKIFQSLRFPRDGVAAHTPDRSPEPSRLEEVADEADVNTTWLREYLRAEVEQLGARPEPLSRGRIDPAWPGDSLEGRTEPA
jgi:hypothetical protein